MDTYVAKAPSTFQKGTYSGGTNKSTGSTFNNAGIKVGAVLHDAVALYSAAYEDVKHGGTATDQIKRIAEELLNLSYELEANVNAGKYEPTTAKKTTEALSPITQETDIDTSDSLDNIDF